MTRLNIKTSVGRGINLSFTGILTYSLTNAEDSLKQHVLMPDFYLNPHSHDFDGFFAHTTQPNSTSKANKFNCVLDVLDSATQHVDDKQSPDSNIPFWALIDSIHKRTQSIPRFDKLT